jgi:hypothetical protein
MAENVRIPESDVINAASKGMDAFLKLFTDRYSAIVGDDWTPESMGRLNSDQMTLLIYSVFCSEVMDGGFLQLIYNGYGPLVFENPFAKAMRLYDPDGVLHDFSNLIYKARRLYETNKDNIMRERTDEEFMAMFEQYEAFNDLDDAFVIMEESVTESLARYVDEHIERFAEVYK